MASPHVRAGWHTEDTRTFTKYLAVHFHLQSFAARAKQQKTSCCSSRYEARTYNFRLHRISLKSCRVVKFKDPPSQNARECHAKTSCLTFKPGLMGWAGGGGNSGYYTDPRPGIIFPLAETRSTLRPAHSLSPPLGCLVSPQRDGLADLFWWVSTHFCHKQLSECTRVAPALCLILKSSFFIVALCRTSVYIW